MIKNKLNKKDYLNITCLSLLYLFIVLIITHGENMYGSVVDWSIQHYSIPEYFRTLFYDTHNLFPQFAPNLGGGQNIFYFAYYGLLSPIILLSYVFPFIKMYDYITISTIITGIVSIMLFYKWLKNNGYDKNTCLVITCLFLCAAPLIFHSHRHIMFINYMPFLILGLMGVDKHFKQNKSYLLILSIFLIIMTSYFYSVGSIIGIVIYGIYTYIKTEQKPNIKNFSIAAIKFAIPVLTAIMMAAILLLPVIYALLSGRIHGDVPVNIMQLILPHFGLEYLLYSPYSVGLTAILLIALFTNLITKDNANKFLSISLLLIVTENFFIYLLNGTLYLDGKALIPLLPLYCLSIANFIKSIFDKKIEFYNILTMFAITLILTILFSKAPYTFGYIIDGFITIFILYWYYKTKDKKKLIIPLMIFVYMICIVVNFSDKLVTKENHKLQNNPDVVSLVDKITNEDKTYYRIYTDTKTDQDVNKVLNINENLLTVYSSTYNRHYNNFFYHTFNNNIKYRNSVITHENKNIIFETYMGVKYLITDKKTPLGYKKIAKKGEYTLYQNEDAMPVGYASANILNNTQYQNLKYPYKLEAMLENIIVEKAKNKTLTSHMQEYKNQIESQKIENLKITDEGHKLKIHTIDYNKNGYIKIKLKEKIKDQILLIRINVSNPQSCLKGDTSISINGIKNKLTCKEWKYYNHNRTFDYTISSEKGLQNLDIKFTKGEYTIDNIQAYIIDYKYLNNLKNNVDPFIVDKKSTKGDKIQGQIDVTKKGYFTLSTPYDEGFTIKVDGKQINYEKVNGTFIGFKIDKGHHKIEITYEAPYFNIGKIISLVGIILFILIIVCQSVAQKQKV